MRIRLVIAIAAIGLAGFASSAALGRLGHQLACTTTVGKVDGYHVTAGRTCGSVTVGATLMRVETLSTKGAGTDTFHTVYLAQCKMGPGATKDVVAPTAKIAIKHLLGNTWCRHTSGGPQQWLATVPPGNTITVSGSLVGLSSSEKGSSVQVVEGTVTITSRRAPAPVTVAAGQQVFLPATGAPGAPTTLVLSPTDQVSVKELQVGVVEMGQPQVNEHLRSRAETTVVIVGDTPASAKRMAAQLRGVKFSTLTAAQVKANPSAVGAALTKLKAHSVVTVGDFNAISPAWDTMRQSDLPAGTAIVYATP